MITLAAIRAGETPCNPIDHHLIISLEQYHEIKGATHYLENRPDLMDQVVNLIAEFARSI